MKMRKLVSFFILILAVLMTTVSSVSASDMELLFQAVKSGDVAEVKRLIEKGVDVDARDKHGFTALMSASYWGYTMIAKLLIEEGADVNAKDKGGTALMYASGEGYTEVAKLLVETGADVNAQNNEGNTALIWASLKGYTEVAKLLVEAGADVNIKRKEGATALMCASYHWYKDIAEMLIEEGATTTGNPQQEPKCSIIMDASVEKRLPQVKQAWASYGALRCIQFKAYYAEHKTVKGFRYTFEMELEALNWLAFWWAKIRSENNDISDKYLDELLTVYENGYMAEYVYVNCRRDYWPDRPDLKIDEFRAWCTDNLKDHQVETLVFVLP